MRGAVSSEQVPLVLLMPPQGLSVHPSASAWPARKACIQLLRVMPRCMWYMWCQRSHHVTRLLVASGDQISKAKKKPSPRGGAMETGSKMCWKVAGVCLWWMRCLS